MRMKKFLVLIAILGLMFAVGCSQQRANTTSVKDNVEKQFEQADMDDINIDEDREHKVLTLKGDVKSADIKDRAESMAKAAAPGWTIANELLVQPEGDNKADDIASEEDKAIKAQWDAWTEKNNVDGIDFDVKNGVVTLEGNVKSAAEEASLMKAAKNIKGVQQVVDKLEIGDRASVTGTDMDNDGHKDTAKPGDDPSSKKK